MASGFYFDYDPAKFYVWSLPGNALSIHLSLNLVTRLAQECLRAAQDTSSPELIGLLLGYSLTTPRLACFIEDFAVLPDETGLEGKSPARRLGVMARRVGSIQTPIGFFRWQRGGWLSLTECDLEAANRLFAKPNDVVLLIRYSEIRGLEAAFFWREDGLLAFQDSRFEFPFQATLLSLECEPQKRSAPGKSMLALAPWAETNS